VPSTARLKSILRDVVPVRDDAQPVVTWPTGEVRRYRGRLYAMQPLGPPPPNGWRQEISPDVPIELPLGLGSLSLKPVTGSGISLVHAPGPLIVTFRTGDRSAQGGSRDGWGDLGNLFRECGVVPWMRERLPLVSCEGQLVAIADLWVRRSARASQGETGLQVLRAGGPPAD
jgi:tRNA(Ile)-lysidine synthase